MVALLHSDDTVRYERMPPMRGIWPACCAEARRVKSERARFLVSDWDVDIDGLPFRFAVATSLVNGRFFQVSG